MKKGIQIVYLLTFIVLSSIGCKKKVIPKETDVEFISVSPCGKLDQINIDHGLSYSLLATVENVDATIVKNIYDNKTYFFKITFENSEYWLSPCNLTDEFKIDGLDVKLSVKMFRLNCPKKTGCPNGDYPTRSELIKIQKK